MRKVLVRFVTLAIVLSALTVLPAAPADAAVPEGTGVHSIGSGGGLTLMAAVKSDGRLYTRHKIGVNDPSWSPFLQQGLPGWSSVAVDVDAEGYLYMVAVKNDGRLYTRFGQIRFDVQVNDWRELWDPWVQHGAPTWSTTAAPSIAGLHHAPDLNSWGATVVLGAVKADGRLYTREFTATTTNPNTAAHVGSWGGWTSHGLATWSRVDVVAQGRFNSATSRVDQLRAVWFVGTKQDGRLFTRKRADGGDWEGYVQHGLPTWDAQAEPSISAGERGFSDNVMVGGVKTDGRLFTRIHNANGFANWVQHGGPGWVAADTLYSGGRIWILGTKGDGAMFSRWVDVSGGAFIESPWTLHGLLTWAGEQPSLSRGNSLHIVAVKTDGRLFTRESASNQWFGYAGHGLPTWKR